MVQEWFTQKAGSSSTGCFVVVVRAHNLMKYWPLLAGKVREKWSVGRPLASILDLWLAGLQRESCHWTMTLNGVRRMISPILPAAFQHGHREWLLAILD